MRVFTLNDVERTYHAVGLSRYMWKLFENDLVARAKETRTTGKRSQLNHFKGHVRQIVEDSELGYQGRELEWIVMCEAMHRGYPRKKVMLKDGTVVEVPLDPHSEVEKKDFGVLIEILHEIAYDNAVVLKEYGNDYLERTGSKDEDPSPETAEQVSDSSSEGHFQFSGGASPLPSSRHEAEQQEVSAPDQQLVESSSG